jgi:antitoxin (DNA-binding transcriptional repressor) of toxin-antitoxin stability system
MGERSAPDSSPEGHESMTTIVKVGEAKTHLSDLLARVEAGEEITIARGDVPIAKLTRIEKANDLAAVLAEILAWKREGARGV